MNIKEIYKCQNKLMKVLKAKKSTIEVILLQYINYKKNIESIKNIYFLVFFLYLGS